MTWIHFKLSFNGKTYRFAPTVQGDQLFQAVKDQVDSLAKEDDYKLCWDDGESTMLLDTEDDFSNMMEYAKEKAKGSIKPPCIHLLVGPASSENFAPAAAVISKIAAVVDQIATAPAVDAPVAVEASENPAAASPAAPATFEEATPVVWRFSKRDHCDVVTFTKCNLRSLLDVADEKRRVEMDELKTLAEDLTTNAEKRLTVESFSIRPSYHGLRGGDVGFDLSFKSLPDYSMWKTCIESALSMLNIDESALQANKFPAYPGASGDRWHMHVELDSKDLKRVLDLLKPVAGRTHFVSISVDETQPKHMRLLPDFLDGATVKSVTFNCSRRIGQKKSKKAKPMDFSPSLNLLQKVKATELMYYREWATKELFDFLEEAAALVDQITIGSLCYEKKKEEPLPLSLAKTILSKKCTYLNVSDTTTKITLAEVEEMVKFFDEKDMKVSLAIPTKEKMMDIKVGAYRVKHANLRSSYRGNNQLLVEHEDMERKMEEIEQERYDC